MRNLAAGNKMNFTIFTFVVILILVLLASAVTIMLRSDKEQYQVSDRAFIYDDNYNYIELESTATISKKWTGNYYLKEDYTNKEYKLGSYGISYEKSRNTLDLFGNFYQVFEGGNISKISGYNTINVSYEDKFYKIDDRKYLIIARNIKNDTGSLSTKNYLLVIIDKLGNALLLNNEINVKTINKMIISTDDYDFDVANELLRFNKEQINLKKIIGSTNEYKSTEENKQKEENVVVAANDNKGGTSITTTTNNNSTSTQIIQNGSNGQNTNDNKWVDSLNGWIQNVGNAFESIYNKSTGGNSNKTSSDSSENRSLALNNVLAGTTYLDINYTVNDPNSEFNIVYAYISGGAKNYNISLDKKKSTYRLTGLEPNTIYTVDLGYKTIQSDSSTRGNVEDTMVTRTTKPNESLKITKLSQNTVYYSLNLDSSFAYDEGCIKVYIDGIEDPTLKRELNDDDLKKAAESSYTGNFEISSGYSSITIQLEETIYNKNEVTSQAKATIINY